MENQQLEKKSTAELLKDNTSKKFEALKNEALAISSQCTSIKISDETTLMMAQQTLSKANQLFKAIEEKRTTIKKPYLDAGKLIDSIAKDITKPIEDGLEFGKKAMREWNEKQILIQKQKEEENQKIVARINSIKTQLQEKVDKCDTPQKCQNLIESINKVFPALESFKQYAPEAKLVKDNFVMLLAIRKQTQQAALDGNVGAVSTGLDVAQRIDDKIQEAAANIEEKKELISDNNVAIKSNTRAVWKFEVVDENSLIAGFVSADEKKIREYMNSNKDKLNPQGSVIGGVKFYVDNVPVVK